MSKLNRLQFGTSTRRRARRRTRIRRLSLLAWVVSTVALAGGPLLTLNQAEVIDLAWGEPSPAPTVSAGASEIAIDSSRDVAEEPTNETHKKRRGANKTEAGSYSGSVTEIIHAAAAEFGVDGDYLVSIAECESGLDPNAFNSAGYHGLFQYDQTTWAAYGEGDIFDPVAQARVTAKLIADGQSSRWPNCA